MILESFEINDTYNFFAKKLHIYIYIYMKAGFGIK